MNGVTTVSPELLDGLLQLNGQGSNVRSLSPTHVLPLQTGGDARI